MLQARLKNIPIVRIKKKIDNSLNLIIKQSQNIYIIMKNRLFFLFFIIGEIDVEIQFAFLLIRND